MPETIALSPEAVADLPHPDDDTNEIASDLAYRRLAMVNVVFSACLAAETESGS